MLDCNVNFNQYICREIQETKLSREHMSDKGVQQNLRMRAALGYLPIEYTHSA